MFAWFTRTRNRPARRLSPTARLGVEQLESRYCPAAPVVTLTGVQELATHRVQLSGHVTDEFNSGLTITFSGAASGNTTTDSSGDFATNLNASQLGTLNANVSDQWSQAAQAATVTLTNSAPVIENFTGTCLDGSIWKFTGRVVDEVAAGLVVRFSGLSAVSREMATVNSDGTFSLTVDLSGQHGNVQCQVTDWWNVDSTLATYTVY